MTKDTKGLRKPIYVTGKLLTVFGLLGLIVSLLGFLSAIMSPNAKSQDVLITAVGILGSLSVLAMGEGLGFLREIVNRLPPPPAIENQNNLKD